MASPLYTGFQLFLPISEIVNIPIDQLNYVISQLTCILFGLYLRYYLPHNKVPARWRSLFCLFSGSATVFFMIGWAIWQVLLQLLVCYVIMRFFTSHRHMGTAVFIYAMGHLLVTYVFGVFKPLEHMCYDPTYNLMITTQKITSLAFGLVDWNLIHNSPKGHSMAEERRKWAVRSVPGLVDYLAFTLSFQGVLAGPFCHYNTFVVFLHGKDPRNKEEALVPIQYMDHPASLPRIVITKLLAVALWLPVAVLAKPMFPDSRNVDPEFIANTSVPVRVAYLYISLFMDRTKYYITWLLSDVVCNASGLGYTGVDAKGRHTWTGMSNVQVMKIESATSLKKYLDNWNISTTIWLRHVCYQRAPFMGMYLTFLLSSLWHGLYSGYYVTFLSATVCVAVGRKIRATVRPLFQTSQPLRLLYEVITFFGTQITLAFLVLSFVVLDWSDIVRFHSSFYWVLHAGSISLFLLIPSKKPTRSITKTTDMKAKSDKNSNECNDEGSHRFSSTMTTTATNTNQSTNAATVQNSEHKYFSGAQEGDSTASISTTRRQRFDDGGDHGRKTLDQVATAATTNGSSDVSSLIHRVTSRSSGDNIDNNSSNSSKTVGGGGDSLKS